jgi:hypothetical protein
MSEYLKINEIPMVTETLANGDERLLAPFKYRDIIVPAGFEFDGASTPRIFWNIIPPFKGTKRAACIHDWLCKQARSKEDRKEADLLWKEMLKEIGFNKARVMVGYIGVRIGALCGAGVHY